MEKATYNTNECKNRASTGKKSTCKKIQKPSSLPKSSTLDYPLPGWSLHGVKEQQDPQQDEGDGYPCVSDQS
ncbi:hypothetical protein E2C01_003701 [Portunus trituberculatus]|uniref:Uncharacterized protein n=1 Tax=Portunus trituberculatus TaxID=210409 RepID=A0A5B7CPG4_PORTR|nr:hypothetical protein [Portunus trituberculatus]